MIHILEITAPLGTIDGDAAVATLQAQTDKVVAFYPALRDASVSASEGLLTMRLRVAGRSRWDISYKGRRIASSMLRRIGVDPGTGTLLVVEKMPSASELTKAQGRNVSGHVPRGQSVSLGDVDDLVDTGK